MEHLSQQHCFHHARREAVARCPECRRFFCRECVTEHEERLLCRDCLSRLSGHKKEKAGKWLGILPPFLQGASGFILLWFIFFWIGQILLAIPHSFHEGTFWETGWWNLP
jgi:hypothetical protein